MAFIRTRLTRLRKVLPRLLTEWKEPNSPSKLVVCKDEARRLTDGWAAELSLADCAQKGQLLAKSPLPLLRRFPTNFEDHFGREDWEGGVKIDLFSPNSENVTKEEKGQKDSKRTGFFFCWG